MNGLKINYDELDWEDWIVPCGPLYQGQKFTGIAYKENHNGLYEEWEYEEGILHGRNYLVDKKHNLVLKESFYEQGTPVKTHFRWLHNRSLKHTKTYRQGQLQTATIQNSDGKLLFMFESNTMTAKEWFVNGNIRSEKKMILAGMFYVAVSEKYWTENGIWLMTTAKEKDPGFNADHLLNFSFELNTPEEEKAFIHYAQHLLETETNIGIEYLQKNTQHNNPFFRYQAVRLLGTTTDKSSIPFLEALLNDHLQPQKEMTIDWQGTGHSSQTEFTIAKMSGIAINNINGE